MQGISRRPPDGTPPGQVKALPHGGGRGLLRLRRAGGRAREAALQRRAAFPQTLREDQARVESWPARGFRNARCCPLVGRPRQPCPHLALADKSARGMISAMGTGHQSDVVRRAGCGAVRGTTMHPTCPRPTATTTRPRTRTTTWGFVSPGPRPVPRQRGASVRSETARSAGVFKSSCGRAVSGTSPLSRAEFAMRRMSGRISQSTGGGW